MSQSHNHIPQPPSEAENPSRILLYTERSGYVPDEGSDDVIMLVPLIRNDGSVDHGWMRVGTLGERVVLVKGDAQKTASQDELIAAANRWEEESSRNEALKTPIEQELGHQAVLVVSEGGTSNDGESEKLPEIAQVEAAMKELELSMQELDRMPAWRYAIALHQHELYSARSNLSEQGRSQAVEYRRLFQQLKKLRQQAS